MLSHIIKQQLYQALKLNIQTVEAIHGGCISQAYKISDKTGKTYFVKINTSAPPELFAKEAHGLNELQLAGAFKIPEVLAVSSHFIILEFIPSGKPVAHFFEHFGRHLAQLHLYKAMNFGFYEANFIGSSIQENVPTNHEKNNWAAFYFNKRILFQLRLAEQRGNATPALVQGIANLENKIENILAGSEERPSLLHGDLWSGNYLTNAGGYASLIDPAVYYGHREADLAMTKLFGGFSPSFYKSYEETYPLPAGYKFREQVYHLYHVLNHFNLFGKTYYNRAIEILKGYE